jgi:RNA polymerase sigma-70 factor (ECF subfamily)
MKVDFAALESEEAVLPPEKTRTVETGLITAELRQQIYTAVDDLPETYRLLITLRHMDGYSYEEIADVTQLPLGTVKTGIFRARRQLRQVLASYEGTTNE